MLKKIYPHFTRLTTSRILSTIQLPKSFSSTNVKEKIKRERLERMKISETYFPTKSFNDLSLIRNFGIIAHIDAGKTTTTERMLYFAGALATPGEVHDGTTVMDYMDQERDRGITIRAAAITFTWDEHQFNLIDTPGHIDFNAEVERSLRVLDGAIAIFDAVNGVQTQSEIVWKQANKFQVPKIAFVNKMDRGGASLDVCVESIKQRLNVHPFVIQSPIGAAETFQGVLDLIHMKKIIYTDESGESVDIEDLNEGDPLYNRAMVEREKLIDTISNFDDKIAEDYLEGRKIGAEAIERAIRDILQRYPESSCVLYVGTSLKNKGVQPLMDGVIKYLPSPNERQAVIGRDVISNVEVRRFPKKDDKLCALAFKVINDINKGPLVYVRIYSGTFMSRITLFNVTKNTAEKSAQIFRVRADEYVGVQDLHAGDIAAVAGLKNTFTGDTLIDSKDDERIVLQGVAVPPPVFIASLEYESMKDKKAFDHACEVLTREDPSLSVKDDEETGQILVYGLGELHLEIFRDRLESEFKLKTRLGKMRVSYRESVGNELQSALKMSEPLYGRPSYAYIELKVEKAEAEDLLFVNESQETSNKIVFGNNVFILDVDQGSDFMKLYNEFKRRMKRKKSAKQGDRDEIQEEESHGASELANVRVIRNEAHGNPVETYEDEYGTDNIYEIRSAPFEIFYSIEMAVQNALASGALLGAPMMYTKVTLVDGKYSESRSNDIVFQMCTATLMKDIIQGAGPVILEPVMDMEISTPTSELKHVMNDVISGRRGRVNEIEDEKNVFGTGGLQRTTLHAVVPLEATIGYSTFLRSITQGEAHFLMKFKQYDEVSGLKQKEILETYY